LTIVHRESRGKYWYKQKAGKPGKQLPPNISECFSTNISFHRGDEREIFRMKAEVPVSRPTLIHELVQEFFMSLRVARPATIAPIDLVMVVLLVFDFHEKLSSSRLADALHAPRMAVCRETKDLMWKGEHMSYYLVFLDRLERLGEAAMNTGDGKDAQVAMDVDPPPKRQRTGDYTLTSLSSPVSSVSSVAVPSRSTSTPQRRAQLQQAS
ncbi:hypothetical protein EDB89DRAFT_2050944, partial [Lactarius sanguifluus]